MGYGSNVYASAGKVWDEDEEYEHWRQQREEWKAYQQVPLPTPPPPRDEIDDLLDAIIGDDEPVETAKDRDDQDAIFAHLEKLVQQQQRSIFRDIDSVSQAYKSNKGNWSQL